MEYNRQESPRKSYSSRDSRPNPSYSTQSEPGSYTTTESAQRSYSTAAPRSYSTSPSPRSYSTTGQSNAPKAYSTRPSQPARDSRPASIQSEAIRGKGQPDEIKLCGYNACQKLYDTRAEDIIRVYLVESRLEEFSELIKSCVRRRKAYHIVTPADMEKISGSSHHEGVCIIAKRRVPPTWDLFLAALEDQGSSPGFVLILEDIANPHNVGAILRSSANFGCRYIILPNEKDFKPSAALLRTAEGGGETVEFISGPSIAVVTTELRQRGMTVLGTALKGRVSLYSAGEAGALPARMAVILGNEARGLSADARKAAAGMIAIPGSGAVQSLNVGVAAALVAGEYFRQHGLAKPTV